MDTSDKETYTEAVQANDLRKALTSAAKYAVKYQGANRDWANERLVQLGADPITTRSEYRVSVAISGDFGRRISAHTREEALGLFMQELNRVLAAGKINIYSDRYDNVYHVKTTAEPVFFSGPADAPKAADEIPTLAALKDGIRAFFKDAVAAQGWGYHTAQSTLSQMGLEALPERVSTTVSVPVTGTTTVTVQTFAGDNDDAVRAAVASKLAGVTDLSVKGEEIGEPVFESAEVLDKPDGDDDGDEDDENDSDYY